MSSGCRLAVGGWGGPVTWRPGGPIWSSVRGREANVAFSFWAWLTGSCMCEVVWVGVRSSRGVLHWPGGVGTWVCAGGVGGPLGGVGTGARGPSRRVCVGCLWGVVRGVRWVGVWRACAGVRAGGGGPCPSWWAFSTRGGGQVRKMWVDTPIWLYEG